MPLYEIEQYEIHAATFQVEAKNEAEAIAKLFNGEAEFQDNSLDYVETAEDVGLPVEEYRELVAQLQKLGVTVGPDVIPSIRCITEIG